MAQITSYALDEQVGHVLRRVNQRHLAIFAQGIPELTPPQFAVVARLSERGPLSQNELGRSVALDAATVKGVVDRLARQGLVATTPDATDRRRLTVSLTPAGQNLFGTLFPKALGVTRATLEPLTPEEARMLLALLRKLT